ncbi:MAG: hypothetical protein RLZZ303_1605 [Candidatus Hydrogenedentota bacterium]
MRTQSDGSQVSKSVSLLAGLTARQVLLLLLIGVAYWFGGALAVRVGAPLGIFGPVASLASFAAAFPVAWGGVWLAAKLAQLRSEQVVSGIAVGTIGATCCDGIALTWFRSLYGSETELVLYGAAWILWGVAAFFVTAILESYRTAR